MHSPADDLVVRGKSVRFEATGLARLNDIWAAADATDSQRPAQWLRLPSTKRFVAALAARVVGKSHNLTRSEERKIFYTERGIGSFAEVRLALAYAEYLDPNLAVEVREVFLRFKVADPTLADELLERATPQANEWVARRAMGRAVRNEFTTQLSRRGVRAGKEYAICTNVTYKPILGGTAAEIREKRNLPAQASLRDNLTMAELAYVAAAEALSVEHMQDADSQGFVECHAATATSAQAIGRAIAASRVARRKPVDPDVAS